MPNVKASTNELSRSTRSCSSRISTCIIFIVFLLLTSSLIRDFIPRFLVQKPCQNGALFVEPDIIRHIFLIFYLLSAFYFIFLPPAHVLFCCLPPAHVLFCCLPPVCVLFCSFMSHVMRLLILAVYVFSRLSLPFFPFLLRICPLFGAVSPNNPLRPFAPHFMRVLFLGSSAGCHPAFICSCSTLFCAREFRERVAIAFFPSLSCARHLRWRVFFCYLRCFSPPPNPFKKYIIYLYII